MSELSREKAREIAKGVIPKCYDHTPLWLIDAIQKAHALGAKEAWEAAAAREVTEAMVDAALDARESYWARHARPMTLRGSMLASIQAALKAKG